MIDDRWPDSWAPYMTWSKHHAKTECDLSGSNLLPCTLEEFPEAVDAMALYGRNDDGWPPLVEAIASRYGVGHDQVTTGPGGSGANFLALAALLRIVPDTLRAEVHRRSELKRVELVHLTGWERQQTVWERNEIRAGRC